VVICLERGADLHTARLMPLPLTVSCFSIIQIGFTFLVPAHPGSRVQRAVKRVCVQEPVDYSLERSWLPCVSDPVIPNDICTYYYYYAHLKASFPDNLGKPVPERENQSGFKCGKR